MKLKAIVFFVILHLCISNASSQSFSQAEFENYYTNKTHSIAKKIYGLVLNGKLDAYWSDSLTTRINVSEARLQASKHVQKNKENAQLDTQYFNPDSLVADFYIHYAMQAEAQGKTSVTPLAIAPIYVMQYNNISYKLPMFYIRYSAVLGAITSEEKIFLNVLSNLKVLDVSHNNSLYSVWEDYGQSGVFNSTVTVDVNPVGKWLSNLVQNNFLQNIGNGNIRITDAKNTVISAEEFYKRHTIKVKYEMMVPGDWGSYSGAMKDTLVNQLPTRIDSISIEKQNKKPVWVIWQLKHDDNISWEKYYLSIAESKKAIPARIWPWYDLFLKEIAQTYK